MSKPTLHEKDEVCREGKNRWLDNEEQLGTEHERACVSGVTTDRKEGTSDSMRHAFEGVQDEVDSAREQKRPGASMENTLAMLR